MNAAVGILERAWVHGIRLEPRGEKLRIIATRGLPVDLRDQLAEHKAAILAILASPLFPLLELRTRATLAGLVLGVENGRLRAWWRRKARSVGSPSRPSFPTWRPTRPPWWT